MLNHSTLRSIGLSLQDEISSQLANVGLFARVFGRAKDTYSIQEKIERKQYRSSGKKMQDLIGIRVTCYFPDDIEIVRMILERKFQVVESVFDKLDPGAFLPIRKNLVIRLPSPSLERFELTNPDKALFDSTFEVQLRTVFSEGWHEVEHDLRYKNKPDWADSAEDERRLFGALAALEVVETSILSICESRSYGHYKRRSWSAMLREKMRLRLAAPNLSQGMVDYLNQNPDVCRQLLKTNRDSIVLRMLECSPSLPLVADNIVYVANEIELKIPALAEATPSPIRESLGVK
jgi:ppGpp synthetase/RelA/SpoT-type nucleotidyltranferase